MVLRVKSGYKIFQELALLSPACKVLSEVGAHKIFHGDSITVVRWHSYGRGGVLDIFHGESITVAGWHGYERGRAHDIYHGISITVACWHGYERDRGA